MSQSTNRGYGFEYAVLHEADQILNGIIAQQAQNWINNTGIIKFNSLTANEQQAMLRASREIVTLITQYEPWLLQNVIEIQHVGSLRGSNDVSDVRFTNSNNNNQSVGLSLKSNHDAVRHPRVSPTIDIAQQWLGVTTDQLYMNEIGQIINDFLVFCSTNNFERYNQLSNQEKDIYLYRPITVRFADLLNQAFTGPQGPQSIAFFLRYLIGDRDFYKAKADFRRNEITIEAYDLTGSLGTRSPLRMPARCFDISVQTGREGMHNYINITFDQGWELRMRLHSARTAIENSLKWDVKFVGTPHNAWSTRIRF